MESYFKLILFRSIRIGFSEGSRHGWVVRNPEVVRKSSSFRLGGDTSAIEIPRCCLLSVIHQVVGRRLTTFIASMSYCCDLVDE